MGEGRAGFDDEKVAEGGLAEERERHRLGLRRPSDGDVDDTGEPHVHSEHRATPDELAIHCRLIRGQYQYYVPRSRKHRKDANGQPISPSSAGGPPASPTAGGFGSGSGDDDERGRERVGGYHAWNVVIIKGEHCVVDLIYQPSMLYHEASREAMHYNRGRRGSPKQTGLTNLPIRDVREIEWSEFTAITSMKDGGFGRVEKAKWRGIDVVIKTPLTADSYVIKTFIEEARVLNTLSHPNIVQLIGVCSAKKAIIIEYINGGDVHQWIKSKKATTAISLKQRLDVLIQCALAMQYLHGCEPPIVHRDLKTLNLLIQVVGERRVIKVCFPQDDHQVLTSDGFKDFDDFRRALEKGEAVSVACPVRRRASDPLDQLALEYHDVRGLDALVDESAVELVEMRRKPTVSTRRLTKSDDEQTVRAVTTNSMDLLLTPEHELPVGLAAYPNASSHARAPVRRVTAREVLDARVRDGRYRGAGVECAAFVCHAVHGVSDPSPHQPLPFAVALGLTTEDEVDAFVELYGYWLGDGSLTGYGMDAVTFGTYKDLDVEYLDDLFRRLPLRELPPGRLLDRRGFKKCDSADVDDWDEDDEDDVDHLDDDDDDDQGEDDVILVQDEQQPGDSATIATVVSPRVRRKKCSYRIYDPTWFRYFAEQYGHKYWSPSMREAAVAGARRRRSGLPLPRYPGFYNARINSSQRLRDVRDKLANGCLVIDSSSFATPTRSRASSSSSPPTLSRSIPSPEHCTPSPAGLKRSLDAVSAEDQGDDKPLRPCRMSLEEREVKLARVRDDEVPHSRPSLEDPDGTRLRRHSQSPAQSVPASPCTPVDDDDDDLGLTAPPDEKRSPREPPSPSSSSSSAPPQPSSPPPHDAEDMSSAKWAWWWVWQRLCARRLRLLLRGLRFADGDQARELIVQRRLVAKAAAARKKQRSADAAAVHEQLRSSRETAMPLTSVRIHTASARCREEYLHMALRAGFTATASLKRRVEHTNVLGQTSVRPLWQVAYKGEGMDSVRPRLVINPSESNAARLGVPQLKQKEINLVRLAAPKKVWCVRVPTDDHLIIVRRVKRDGNGDIVESSRPTVVGNCDFGLARNQKNNDGISTQHKDMGTPWYARTHTSSPSGIGPHSAFRVLILHPLRPAASCAQLPVARAVARRRGGAPD